MSAIVIKALLPTPAHHAATAAKLPVVASAAAQPLAPNRFFLHVGGDQDHGRARCLTPKVASMSIDIKPHAYDPVTQPELFEGVLPRRVVAFIIDFIIIAIPVVLAAMFIFAFGIVTLGLGWALYWLLPPGTVIWAIAYFGLTLASPASATIGMRVMDLEMRTWYGAPAYFVLGAVHAIAFWVSVSALTPFILLVCFFNERRRLLHDIVLGTVVINNAQRAAMLRAGMADATG
jgi:uncharacterized RDD family membrane protein YckC